MGLLESEFNHISEVRKAFLKKIRLSGLLEADARKLRMRPMMADEVATRLKGLPASLAGFLIPYFSEAGKPTEFFRFRYLEFNRSGWNAVAPGKELRYGQVADTLNEVYLAPFTDWRAHLANKDLPLVITEGELKAACATKNGIPTIGLGGVWCFRSASKEMALLPQLEKIDWHERTVYICYDSDAISNYQVIGAENALARELTNRGAKPHITRIPALKAGEKTGIDDFIVAKSADDFLKLLRDQSTPWKASEELFKLNEEVVYVRNPGVILQLSNLQRITPRAFVDHAYADRIYTETQETAQGSKLVERSAPKEWVKWRQRAIVQSITYKPGSPRITDKGELNVWPGWGCLPKKGDTRPWEKFLEFLFRDSPETDRRWFEQWLAYPLQYPGTKLFSAAVVWGLHQGTGKSLVGYTMFRIYGRNATEISEDDLYSPHNEWAEYRQFTMGDEIMAGDGKRYSADKMKSKITQSQLRINAKYIPAYVLPDCINYYFTSNHPDSFFLDDRDRRFFIHEVVGGPLPPSWYTVYVDWLDSRGGKEAIFYRLLNLDLSGFEPQGHARNTLDKDDMKELGRSDLGLWVSRLREHPDSVTRLGGVVMPWKLWTTTQLQDCYDKERTTKVTGNGLARELRRAGFRKVYKGAPVLTKSDGRQKLWAIRDTEKILNIDDNPRLAKIYDEERSTKALAEAATANNSRKF